MLTPSGSYVIALQATPGDEPLEILTDGGGLSNNGWPIKSVLQDERTLSWLEEDCRRLFVCESISHVVFLRSLSLSATLAHGLADLNQAKLDEASRELGWTPGTSRAKTGPIRVVLVNWNPETIEPADNPKIRQVAAHLAKIEKHTDTDLTKCSVWSPTAEELEKVKFCLEFGSPEKARELLLESADKSIFAISAYLDKDFLPRRKPKNYFQALQALEETDRQLGVLPASHVARHRAQKNFESFVDRDLIEPLIEQSMRSDDPLQKNLGVLIANSFRSLHYREPSLQQKMLSLTKNPSNEELQNDLFTQLTQRERLLAGVVRLAKELGR